MNIILIYKPKSTKMSVTFEVDPTKVPDTKWHDPTKCVPMTDSFNKQFLTKKEYNQQTCQYDSHSLGTVMKNTGAEKNTVGRLGNGFVSTCTTAYNQHYPLELSPDNVWLAIMTVFAGYIDRNSEKLRDHFVSHDGKKQLTVNGGGTIHTANWDALIDKMSELIDQNTKNETRNFITCKFSTTTQLIETVSKVTLMSAMKNYFDYKFCLQCGLPKVRLTGTLEDWQEIRRRIDRLPSYDVDGSMAKWTLILQHVADRFIETYQQASNGDDISAELKNFWNSICHHSGGGSGPTYLSGWVLAFVPFDDRGRYYLKSFDSVKTGDYGRLDTNDIPNGFVETPVIIDDNGTEYKTKFYSGHFMAEYVDEFMRPSIDWIMVDVTNVTNVAQ